MTDYDVEVQVTVVQAGANIRVTIGDNRETALPARFIRRVCRLNGTEITLDDIVVGEEYMMTIYGPIVQANRVGMVYRQPTVNLLCIWYGKEEPMVILRVSRPNEVNIQNFDISRALNISRVVFTGKGQNINYYGKRSEKTIARAVEENVSLDDMEFRGHYVISVPREYAIEILGENFNESNL